MRPVRPARSLHRASLVSILSRSIPIACLIVAVAGCNSNKGDTPTASLGTPPSSGTAFKSQPEKPKYNPFPEVEVKTSQGNFTLKLDAQKAPIAVGNFLYYVNRGHYDGTLFHEVYRDFIVLGGGFDEKSTARPTEAPIRNEAHHGVKNTRGTIAMARPADGIDSATNQFFINLADNSSLDHSGSEPSQYGYCVFGEVISGMDVLDRIGSVDVNRTEQFENAPVEPILIQSMRQTN
jgi:cyclophilin family peptidyl-prolyl cis-trans isomerase